MVSQARQYVSASANIDTDGDKVRSSIGPFNFLIKL